MYHKEILATINLAHHFDSAYSADQVFRYLRVPIERRKFDTILGELQQDGAVVEQENALFTRELLNAYRQKRQWSRNLFRNNRRYLSLISKMPFVKFMALTGANAFESCQREDDVDLFIITRKNRLWLCYVALVVLCKLLNKRDILCINYLVDETNLQFHTHDYFTAVQIMHMVPLVGCEMGETIIANNRWMFDYLPNAAPSLFQNGFYRLENGESRPKKRGNGFAILTKLNRLIYRKYAARLQKKYPAAFGKSIVLGEGVAKLNRIDHHDIYDDIYAEIYRKLAMEVSA